tara:strand:+ start:326 stop:580 length:255 start_codon:yes stop_codon:yes gene_type:complete
MPKQFTAEQLAASAAVGELRTQKSFAGYVNIPAGARWDGSRWVPPEASQGSDTRSDAEECDDCEDDDDADREDGDSEDDFGFPW